MKNILAEIISHKKEELKKRKEKTSFDLIEERAKSAPKVQNFTKSLNDAKKNNYISLIAEIKKASPSQGLIKNNFDPIEIANKYIESNAACLSILTDERFFMGSDKYLSIIRNKFTIPILRKDFMIDPYQIIESRAIGSDCILIIVSATDYNLAKELYETAKSWNLDSIFEVHNANEVETALKIGCSIIGINNRNLNNFKVDIETSIKLKKIIPNNITVISESGYKTRDDVSYVKGKSGISSFLIGESLIRSENISKATRNLTKMS